MCIARRHAHECAIFRQAPRGARKGAPGSKRPNGTRLHEYATADRSTRRRPPLGRLAQGLSPGPGNIESRKSARPLANREEAKQAKGAKQSRLVQALSENECHQCTPAPAPASARTGGQATSGIPTRTVFRRSLIPSTFATSRFFAPSRFIEGVTGARVFQRPRRRPCAESG